MNKKYVLTDFYCIELLDFFNVKQLIYLKHLN